METLSSIFSSLKFKKEKAFSSTKSDLQVESSSGTSKVPSVVSGDLEETVDLNASFENT
jgi:hypothetical protein